MSKGETLRYSVETGFLPLYVRDEKGGEKAAEKNEIKAGEIFFIAYRKLSSDKTRPLTFIFNGGPGSSALMLHMDCFGPRTVALGNGIDIAEFPWRLEDNADTLLTVSDLVFIDPIGTGYSRPESLIDPEKTFWGAEADVKSICSFIRLYLTRKGRFASPLYVMGESYGGFRGGAMAAQLQDIGIQLSGLVLISPALNYQDLVSLIGNDRPYIHALPTMASVAWYHKKLSDRFLSMDQETVFQEAKAWAGSRYLQALWKGNTLEEDEKRAVAVELASYTNLSVEEILQLNLRVPIEYFAGNLLREKQLFVGVYDGRCTASGKTHNYEEDPSTFRAQIPAFSMFMNLLTEEMGYVRDEEYLFSNKDLYPKWNFFTGTSNPTNRGGGFTGALGSLSRSLRRNGQMKLFVASGNYDLRCNRGAAEFAVDQLDVPFSIRKKIRLRAYEGGHMFYTNSVARAKFHSDLVAFYAET
ncbi:MAG: hypothetical protein LBP21_11260 [Synergistaceae bacterium]|jgi:carboxypeptidase C (cathepsin A)|nr:hypothetical protein [Synergistaceae bacterium]